MMKLSKGKQILIWTLAFIPLLMTAAAYPFLPDRIPLHWNIAGQVNRTGPKFPYAFLLPAVCLLVPLLMSVVPRIDPRKENYEKFSGAYYWMRLSIVIIFCAINAIIVLVPLGISIDVGLVIKLLVGVTILVIGNLMPKLKPNYFVGIKTPWTFNNEDVWYATHRHGGKLWFAAGLIMCLLALIPGAVSAALYFTAIIASALEPIVYSYFKFRNQKKAC